jgi:hypothetical protein
VTQKDLIKIIGKDKWMMDVLKTVEALSLPDWWIGAGFVRSKVWDFLHEYKKRTPVPDIDVIYFDKKDFTAKELNSFTSKKEDEYQAYLTQIFPDIKWSVLTKQECISSIKGNLIKILHRLCLNGLKQQPV